MSNSQNFLFSKPTPTQSFDLKTTRPLKPSLSFAALLLFITLVSTHSATAQPTYWDVIMLKSAEVIRGTITENIPDTSVTILAGDTLSRIILWEEIELITTEIKRSAYKKPVKKPKDYTSRPNSAHYQGYLAAGAGIAPDDGNFIKISFINGIGFAQAVSFGFGIGFRAEHGNESGGAIPLFGDLRARILKTKIAPVIAVGAGTSLMPHKDSWATGEMMYAEAGISIKKEGNTSFMVTIGWEMVDVFEKVTTRGYFGGSSESLNRKEISGITINVAVGF